MPGGDKTGPVGAGPMTGRAAGYCAGNPTPGYANLGYGGYGRGYYRGGRGYGRGRGRGFGRRWYTPAINPQTNVPITQTQLPEQEATALENYQKNLAAEKADLEQELDGVKARLAELNAKKENK